MSDLQTVWRKMLIYFSLWLLSYVGMLFVSSLGDAQYGNYVLLNGVATGAVIGFFGTPAWEGLKHDYRTS